MSKIGNTNFLPREIYPTIKSWLAEKEIIAIAGPRQAGKTTLLLKIQQDLGKEKSVFVNLEDSENLLVLERSPKEFIKLHLAEIGKSYFLLDEYQYVKNGGKLLKLLFDEFPQAKFIITGSSTLKIKQVASFLVGRVIFFHLYPFSFAEFLSSRDKTILKLWQNVHSALLSFLFSKRITLPNLLYEKKLERYFEEYTTYGGYPAVATSEQGKKETRLSGLIETYIEKDIVKLLKIGNFLDFRNLVTILSAQIGNLLNYSSLSADTTLSFRNIKKFQNALEKTFVIKTITPYYTNKITEIKKSPKVFFIDLGLRNALISDFRRLDIRIDKGAVAENFVFQNLFYRHDTNKLSFWRTKQGAEVDFILSFQNQIIPIEVKYQLLDKKRLPRGLTSFIIRYKPDKAVVLTRNLSAVLNLRGTKILFLPIYFV